MLFEALFSKPIQTPALHSITQGFDVILENAFHLIVETDVIEIRQTRTGRAGRHFALLLAHSDVIMVTFALFVTLKNIMKRNFKKGEVSFVPFLNETVVLSPPYSIF